MDPPAYDSQISATPSSLMPNFNRLLSDHLNHITNLTLGPKSSYKLIRDATIDPNLAEELMSRKRTNAILSSLSASRKDHDYLPRANSPPPPVVRHYLRRIRL